MQYLMMDPHQRFIGTVSLAMPLKVGTTFEAQDTKTYMVVSISGNTHAHRNHGALTVIPHAPRAVS